MQILLEITILVGLNLFLFVFLQRRMTLWVIAQHEQLAVYKRTVKKPKIKERDRVFWMMLSKIWLDWESRLVIVRPETVIRWSRRRFAVAKSPDGEDAVIVTLVGRVQSREGRELERVLAVRLKKGRQPQVLEESSWLSSSSDVTSYDSEFWERRFRSWASDAENVAQEAARAHFAPISEKLRKEHLAILDRERDDPRRISR